MKGIPELRIGQLTAELPIVQGGMGVRISLAGLAAAVANAGGIGTISSIGLGDIERGGRDYEHVSQEALREEIRKARSLTSGPLAVNFMGALRNVEDLVRTAVKEGIRLIVFGAGLPMRLPEVVPDLSVYLIPIVSSARAAQLILRAWSKRYRRTPDALILEGPLAGGHLGFSFEELKHADDYALEKLLPELLATVKPYVEMHGKPIPVIAGGGVFNGHDIARMLKLGAAGVQMGTRFVCTWECDAAHAFKQAYLDAREEDIVIIKSPVGLPGRAIRNRFLADLAKTGTRAVHCPYHCLTACKAAESRFCIAKALLNAWRGDVVQGLVFCGQNAHRLERILSVEALVAELTAELRAALQSVP